MSIFVAAEFDSVDLADLAAGHLRGMPGFISASVSHKSHTKSEEDDGEGTPPFIPIGAGWAFSNGMGVGPFYTAPYTTGFDGDHGGRVEPELAREVLLRVETVDEGSARSISATLRNLGGRSVAIYRR